MTFDQHDGTNEDDRIILEQKPERFGSKEELERFFNSIHCPGFELNRDNDPPQLRELF
jgi:hypothetical protein